MIIFFFYASDGHSNESITVYSSKCLKNVSKPNFRCSSCSEDPKVKNFRENIKPHKLKKITEILGIMEIAGGSISEDDLNILEIWVKNVAKNYVSSEKKILIMRVSLLLKYYKKSKEFYDRFEKMGLIKDGKVVPASDFLSEFISYYQKYPDFRECLLVQLTQAFILKASGNLRAKWSDKIIAFAQAVRCVSTKTYEIIAANISLLVTFNFFF